MALADHQIDAGDSQHNSKEDDGRRRSIGRVTTGIAIEHIVDITDDGIHAGGIQVSAKQCNRVALGLKFADEAGNDQIK